MIYEHRFRENKKMGIQLLKKIASQKEGIYNAKALSRPTIEGVHETNDT